MARTIRGVGVLARGTDLVVDDSAVARLSDQLRAAGPDVTAVIAPVSAPPPGSSFRTHAQQLACDTIDGPRPLDSVPEPGVALVRPGVTFVVDGAHVRVDEGTVLVDPGATSHDPGVSPGPPSTADRRGRPLLSQAPLVLLLGIEPDIGRATWARDMVNALVAAGTEARLAVTSVPEAPHLTTPCAPTIETVEALQPDIVITLDEMALDHAPSWCDRRSTVIVHHTGERRRRYELVSWRIGVEIGRVRAFIGSTIDPVDLGELCSRLTSGPMPMPPRWMELEDADRRVTVSSRRGIRASRRAVLVHGPGGLDDRLSRALGEGAASGWTTTTGASEIVAFAADADAVIVARDVDEDIVGALVHERRAAGRRTVLDLADGVEPGDPRSRLATEAGIATVATHEARHALATDGVTARYLPLLLTRDEADELRRLRLARDEEDDSVRLVVCADPADAGQRLIRDAIVGALGAVPNLGVELDIADHHTLPPLADVTAIAWLHGYDDEPTRGRPLWLQRSACAGVPAAFATGTAGDVDDDEICRWAVDEPRDAGAWATTVLHMLTAATTRPDLLAARGELLFGPKASQALVNRVLGWCAHRLERP